MPDESKRAWAAQSAWGASLPSSDFVRHYQDIFCFAFDLSLTRLVGAYGGDGSGYVVDSIFQGMRREEKPGSKRRRSKGCLFISVLHQRDEAALHRANLELHQVIAEFLAQDEAHADFYATHAAVPSCHACKVTLHYVPTLAELTRLTDRASVMDSVIGKWRSRTAVEPKTEKGQPGSADDSGSLEGAGIGVSDEVVQGLLEKTSAAGAAVERYLLQIAEHEQRQADSAPGKAVSELDQLSIPRADQASAPQPPRQPSSETAERENASPPQEAAWEAFSHELPELLREHNGQWAGYHRDRRFGLGATNASVWQRATELGIPPKEVLVERIEPAALDDITVYLPDVVEG